MPDTVKTLGSLSMPQWDRAVLLVSSHDSDETRLYFNTICRSSVLKSKVYWQTNRHFFIVASVPLLFYFKWLVALNKYFGVCCVSNLSASSFTCWHKHSFHRKESQYLSLLLMSQASDSKLFQCELNLLHAIPLYVYTTSRKPPIWFFSLSS